MAMACATLAEAAQSGIDLIPIVINHQLQSGSDVIALQTREKLLRMGFAKVEIVPVTVQMSDGLEASARRARYAAFDDLIAKYLPDYFFLAHTKNDQAETVLLGLARGSGTRSLSGMAQENGKYVRPLLSVSREVTAAACHENQIEPWLDPHNDDPQFARVKVRKQALPVLESSLGPGIVDALARSAKILREDADALDGYAQEFWRGVEGLDLEVEQLAKLPKAVRVRVVRLAIYAAGSAEGSVTAEHLAPVEALVTDWHGQGVISLPDGVKVARISGRLSLSQQFS